MDLIEFDKSFTFDEIINSSIKLLNQFAPLISISSMGVSHDNREIIFIKLGYGRKSLICSAGVHARETINTIVLLKIIEEYANSYYWYKSINGIDLRNLLNEYSIIFVPLLNPDGYMISLFGFNSIQNVDMRLRCLSKNIHYSEWKYNARAIDINRNFPSLSFKGTYDMPYSLSENETKALVYLFNNFESCGYVDFHSRGESIFYYRKLLDKNYNLKQLEIAKELQKICGYSLEVPDDEIPNNDSGGNTVHYYSEKFKKPSITVETVKDEEVFPLKMELREEVFKQIYAIPITLLTML